jgi:hypothetical protein
VEVVPGPLPVDPAAVEQVTDRLHHLEGPPVPFFGSQRLARQIARDQVHGQPTVEQVVEGRQLPGQLRRPQLAAAHGHQQADPLGGRRDRGGKRDRVDPEGVARRQQDVVEPPPFGFGHDVAAVLEAAEQFGVGHPQHLVVVVAERREPADLHRARAHGRTVRGLRA